MLFGLLAADHSNPPRRVLPGARKLFGGGLLSVFAMGCPVYNKLVVLALGVGGASAYIASFQPLLGFLSVGLLPYALHAGLLGERACRAVVKDR